MPMRTLLHAERKDTSLTQIEKQHQRLNPSPQLPALLAQGLKSLPIAVCDLISWLQTSHVPTLSRLQLVVGATLTDFAVGLERMIDKLNEGSKDVTIGKRSRIGCGVPCVAGGMRHCSIQKSDLIGRGPLEVREKRLGYVIWGMLSRQPFISLHVNLDLNVHAKVDHAMA